MGFGFKKSKKLGGIRLNLSKSGLGISYGVKGLRVSTNAKGTTLYGGRGGLYYRKKLSSKKEETQVGFENAEKNYTPYLSYIHHLKEVKGEFDYNIFEPSEYVLEELVAFHKLKNGLFNYLQVIFFIIGCFIHWIWILNMLLLAWLIKENPKFIIRIEEQRVKNLENLLNDISDNYILHNALTNEELQYGSLVVKNLFSCSVPFIDLKYYKMCFLDKGLLFYSNKTIFLIPYEKLEIILKETSALMINAPDYAKILSTTYEYVNKDGSPNKRYKNNNEINEIAAYVITIKMGEEISIPLTYFDKEKSQLIFDEIKNLMKG